MDVILVLNAGSSSLKFQVFELGGPGLVRLLRGQIDGIGIHPRFAASGPDGTILIDETHAAEHVPDLDAATHILRDWLNARHGLTPRAIGHRVVHGGPDYAAPVRVDAAVLARLERFETLAPLHQPNNLAPIRLVLQQSPGLPQVACFDTAFHRSHSALADCYALPQALRDEGVRRYGFHGLSYEYIAQRLREVAPDIADSRVIVAHLGSGASMCALKGGRSVESSMGFTAMDGLPMGTRPGQLDPGVVLYLFGQKGMNATQVSDLLYKESGLKGLSGISSDMRDLLASADPRAKFSIDYFVHRCAMTIGALTAALGGLDALVFTAGIGEHAPEIRGRIAERMGWLGVQLDAGANERGDAVFSAQASAVRLMMVPTDEELMIARQTMSLLAATP